MKDRPRVTGPTGLPQGTPLPGPGEPSFLDARFEDLGLVDMGGMGEVRRVRDRELDRVVALKIVDDADRMLAEARAAARLQHPGIVPVYETGRFGDGRGWLAMRLVEGRDLADVFAAAAAGREAWSRQRLVGLLGQVAQAMAYAHAEGVVHRDLTPRNIRVGRFGEVVVLDWGIAGRALATGDGAGTVGYMPPEQFAGARIEPRADVFALGRLLQGVLELTPRVYPDDGELDVLCQRALDGDPEVRPQAEAFAAALAAWLDGATRRAQAAELVATARALGERAVALRGEAEALQARATEILDRLEPHAPEADKAPGWTLEDEARARVLAARRLELDMEQQLRIALQLASDLAEARAALASLYRQRVLHAEAERDTAAAAEHAARLEALEPGRHAAFLVGDGRLTLVTDPPGAAVYLSTWQRRLRRLEPGPERFLGTTPLREVVVPQGSHRLRLVAPGHEVVLLPIYLARGEHVDGVPPGEAETAPVRLPPAGTLGDACYIPGGWFHSGGDPLATEGLPARRVWVDGFVMERHPLTYRRLLGVLNGLVAAGDHELAERIAPSPPAGPDGRGGDGHVHVVRAADGLYRLESTAGIVGAEEWPVTMIDWHSAVAFAADLADRTGLPWRLPHELEREKAARGVDGRTLPWGDFFEPTWACTAYARGGPPSRAPVGDFPLDESAYGVRGLTGNVRDWCHNQFRREGELAAERLAIGPLPAGSGARAIRGGAWGATPRLCHPAVRYAAPPEGRYFFVGLRLARSYGNGLDQSAAASM